MEDCISQPIRRSQVTKKKKKAKFSPAQFYHENAYLGLYFIQEIKDVIEGQYIL